jgi:methionyl aminopeptidase
VARTFEVLRPRVVPGVSTAELDQIAEDFIRSNGARPMYKGYGGVQGPRGRVIRPPFPATLCTSVNDVICHGIPRSEDVLREGDIVGVDVGVLLRGWIGDACVTYPVGQVDDATRRLLEVTQRCLALGIAEAIPGRRLGDVGAAIQRYAEAQGYSVVREYSGHGVGRRLWEEPTVLHHGLPGTGVEIRPGMVFTIEPMVNEGAYQTREDPDRWTVRTADGKRSAQFEHTVAITEDGNEVLTLLWASPAPATSGRRGFPAVAVRRGSPAC